MGGRLTAKRWSIVLNATDNMIFTRFLRVGAKKELLPTRPG